ncbi:ribosome small subunit-dependent GTPase A [Geodermatophilus sp. YIM 151500]|uniref:ribosome small subunit-dependent GTPase A n=1 Tax=Geodermatophilus sp. YIM 151500 TaxID=2984531 RepID=UPI0021E4B1B8|nr:ribosome small subunit-dependent GTPase A [Geodermatophilus sp. YIM 151500]MCV2490250.1 ribosome small subunit-dependent GTPase A [Geodermatophilus sp. YIM 151500]
MAGVTHLAALGWTPDRAAELPPDSRPARVVRVDRGWLRVVSDDGERSVPAVAALHETAPGAVARTTVARTTAARSGAVLDRPGPPGGPAVGDWVALRAGWAVAVLPRRSAFVRTVAGRTSAAQVVAANLDAVLVVDALAGPARPRRVERYLAVAWSSGATPVVVLTKADLCDDVPAAVAQVAEVALGVEVLPVSSVTGEGLAAVAAAVGPGRTAAMVGPSGVGKSSLANALAGVPVAPTREIRADGRGRHTTTARELHVLPGGVLLVDTPGMRELALHDDADGVAAAYADVAELAAACRFRDCAHRTEPGCAVAAAIDAGTLDPARYVAWRKLEAEAHRQALRSDARARATERARVRAFTRALRAQPNRPRS